MKKLIGVAVLALSGCGYISPTYQGNSTVQAQASAQVAVSTAQTQTTTADTNPTISVLNNVVLVGNCVQLNKMPKILAQLHDEEYRFKLGSLVAEGRADPNQALTEWLVQASAYQELCGLHGDPRTEASTYLAASVPLSEASIDTALKSKNCGFLSTVHAHDVWPYEVRMGQEVIQRKFEEAEVTRRLWIDTLGEFKKSCAASLSRRQTIAINATVERLARIVGLDDSSLIELRSKMLDALEKGQERKIVAYAKAISEREAALDSMNAGKYEAKLAAIEQQVESQKAAIASASAAVQARQQMATAQSAQASVNTSVENIAKTVEDVQRTARAARSTVNILKSFF